MRIFNKDTKLIIGLSWIAVILWMLLIFNLSAQPASQSDDLSKGIIKIIMDSILRIVPGMELNMDTNMNLLNHIIRKSAHFIAYLALGVIVSNANRKSGIGGLKGISLTILICVLYAAGDEIHQGFVPGRGPGITDVLIDSAGATVGAGLYLMVANIFNKRKKIAGTNLKAL